MNTSQNKYDAIERIIFEHGLRIKGINFYPDMDLMLIVLNNKKVLKRGISSTSSLLSKATIEQLHHYKFMGDGAGVHWPDLDEDLSLKGFLQDELAQVEISGMV
jgi:hypothetical protein